MNDAASAPPEGPPKREARRGERRLPMRLLVLLLTLLGLWIAHSFLLQLAWAAVMAVALWPLYRRYAHTGRGGRRPVLAPLGFTLGMGLVLMLPLAIVAVEAARDSQAAVDWVTQAQKTGVHPPPWLASLPLLGPRLAAWWQSNLADPRAAGELIGRTDAGALARWTGAVAAQVASRSVFFLVTLLALFVFLQDSVRLAAVAVSTARHFYGPFGERFVRRLAVAVRAAVNGTVFVAIGEGTIIGFGYALAGVPRPVLFAVATIAVAMLPFGAWAAFSVAALVLIVQGHLVAAIALFAFGAAVMLIGDNLVQPALVGNAVQLPFLWTFVATFGGLETFGLVGLFIGPALMAALFFAWREWLGEKDSPERKRRGR
jgi:predicted PurR-regulated permease PerM